MSDLYAERVEAELELTEMTPLYSIWWWWSLHDVAQRGSTYIVVHRNVVQDVTGEPLTCDLCVRCIHIFYLSI